MGNLIKNFPVINRGNPLILASASPRRRRLLEQVRIPFQSLPCNIDETGVDGGPSRIARILAEKKARAAYSVSEDKWVLGADTIVVLDGTVLGKPLDRDEAKSMLDLLGGKEHEVITGFFIIDPSGMKVHSEEVSTMVTMKRLSEAEITAYIATGEPFGKAGSYAVQGIGSFMVKGIRGSYSNVVGLPLCEVIESLVALGAMEDFPRIHNENLERSL